MINLRYHIVSLTAVFLAIGIGLTLGSTFLDRATVENLNGQLENLEQRLGDREARINELEELVGAAEELQTELDEQAVDLLAGRIEGLPVVVVSSRGVDEADVREAVQALVVAGADMQGIWWFTERWALDDEAEIDDLASVLEADSTDPSRLRRMAIDSLGGELRDRQLLASDLDDEQPDDAATTTPSSTTTPTSTPAVGATPTSAPTPTSSTSTPEAGNPDAGVPEDATIDILTELVDAGFVEYEAVADGPETPEYPIGTRMLLVGGSPTVPDDLVVEPLVERMGQITTTPILAVASSAVPEENAISDLVEVIRQDDRLKELISTVDDLEHFDGWAAMVLALGNIGEVEGVGHFGLDDTATRLLPALRAP